MTNLANLGAALALVGSFVKASRALGYARDGHISYCFHIFTTARAAGMAYEAAHTFSMRWGLDTGGMPAWEVA